MNLAAGAADQRRSGLVRHEPPADLTARPLRIRGWSQPNAGRGCRTLYGDHRHADTLFLGARIGLGAPSREAYKLSGSVVSEEEEIRGGDERPAPFSRQTSPTVERRLRRRRVAENLRQLLFAAAAPRAVVVDLPAAVGTGTPARPVAHDASAAPGLAGGNARSSAAAPTRRMAKKPAAPATALRRARAPVVRRRLAQRGGRAARHIGPQPNASHGLAQSPPRYFSTAADPPRPPRAGARGAGRAQVLDAHPRPRPPRRRRLRCADRWCRAEGGATRRRPGAAQAAHVGVGGDARNDPAGPVPHERWKMPRRPRPASPRSSRPPPLRHSPAAGLGRAGFDPAPVPRSAPVARSRRRRRSGARPPVEVRARGAGALGRPVFLGLIGLAVRRRQDGV